MSKTANGFPDKGKDEHYYIDYFREREDEAKGIDVDLAQIRYRQGLALLEARKVCKKKGSWSMLLTTLNIEYSTAYAYIRVAKDITPDAAVGKTWTELLAMVFPSFKRAPEGYEPDAEKPAKKASTIKKALSQTSNDLEIDEDEEGMPIDESDKDADFAEEDERASQPELQELIEEAPSTDPGEPSRGIQFSATNPRDCKGWLDIAVVAIARAYAMAHDCPESDRAACKDKTIVALANLEKVLRRIDDPSYDAELSAA